MRQGPASLHLMNLLVSLLAGECIFVQPLKTIIIFVYVEAMGMKMHFSLVKFA